MQRRRVEKVCCIGAGYVGGPTCALIANKNPNIEVTVVDLSEPRIAAWNSSILPIFEPGLQDIVEVARDGSDGRIPNLHFSTDVSGAILNADLIFIAVNTPTKTAGVGAGSASDLGYVESAARTIAEVATTDKIIVEKSTVPCGTAERLRSIFHALAPTLTFDILSNPEFLAEGTAVNDLMVPDRILIGSQPDERSKAASQALAAVYSWVAPERVITINLWSSELAKLAANCMLAQRISSINSLSALCEATGADISELSYAVGRDTRIGNRMLKASAGFGGSCFKKDVLSLVYIAESLHLSEVAQYWRAVETLNEYQKTRFAKRITAALHNTLLRKRIAILGWAYKKDTGDTRESAAIGIAGQLLAEGALLAIYDPQVSEEQIYRDLEQRTPEARSRIEITRDACTACVGACAVVILTEWVGASTHPYLRRNDIMRCQSQTKRNYMLTCKQDEFKTDTLLCLQPMQAKDLDSSYTYDGTFTAASSDSGIDVTDDRDESGSQRTDADGPLLPTARRIDWEKISSVVRRPKLLFDGRNIVEGRKLAQLGFVVESVGKASVF